MSRYLSRRGQIRAVSFLIAAFLILCGITIAKDAEARQYQRAMQNTYIRAFSELTASVDRIDTALEKAVYTTSSRQLCNLCAEIFGQAMTAQQALGQLPYANVELEQTAAFVSKVGDYANALARSAAQEEGYAGQQLETVKALSRGASELRGRLDGLESELYDGVITLEDVETAERRMARSSGETGETVAGSSYQDIEAEFPETPTLIYDGPFSEHLSSRRALMLENVGTVTEEEALKNALDFAGLTAGQLTLLSPVEGEFTAWLFGGEADGEQVAVTVTQSGGYILSMSRSRSLGDETVSREEAVDLARKFLDRAGFEGGANALAESYYTQSDGVLTINLAGTQEGVICYPDLVKVSVALDTGEIVGFECGGYLMNHGKREMSGQRVPVEQARKEISPELTILSEGLAIIPTQGEHEVLCWEFYCENNQGRHYISYINAGTGQEQQLLLLLEDETGTLAI